MEQFEALNDNLKTAQYQFKHDENHRRATPAPLAIADGDVTGEGPKDDLADNMSILLRMRTKRQLTATGRL